VAWAVVSPSAEFVGLYRYELHAIQMLQSSVAPPDSVMFALQEIPGSRRDRLGNPR
jgi:hypothetical protein